MTSISSTNPTYLTTILCLSLTCIAGRAASPDTSIEDAIKNLRSAYAKLTSISFICSEKQYAQSPNLPEEVLVQVNDYSVAHDAERWRILKRTLGIDLIDSQIVSAAQTYEFAFVEKRAITAGITLLLGKPATEQQPIRVLVDFEPKKVGSHYLYDGFTIPGLVFGSLSGDGGKDLADILSNQVCTLKDAEVVVAGHSTVLLETVGPLGAHRVWLDAKSGLPRRIEVTKQGNDILDFESVENRKSAMNGRIPPAGKLMVFREVVDDIRTQRVGEMDVIVGFQCTLTYEYDHDQIHTVRSVIRLSDVRLMPKCSSHDFEITTAIPNGTAVSNEREPKIQYEWQDGKIQVRP